MKNYNAQSHEVVTTAPTSGFTTGPPPQRSVVEWMSLPLGVTECPPGLEYLTQVDQLLVHQQVELLEVLTGFETQNRYQIKNSLGQQCYFAEEESDFCMRICCGPNRGFQMHITDNSGKEVIRVVRQFKCCAGCCWCANGGHCSFIVNVEAPPGNVIGQVVQSESCWAPHYRIFDHAGDEAFLIKGPCCVCSGVCCTGDVPFEIFVGDTEGPPVGRISRQYSGAVKELFTDATNFSVNFPMDLDVKLKAVILGATFLIDFMFFESNQNNNQ